MSVKKILLGNPMKIFFCGALVLMLASVIAAQQAPIPVEEEPHHHLVLKNDSVVVLRVKLLPGESTLYHTHSRDRMSVFLTDTTIAEQKPGEPEGSPAAKKPGDIAATTTNSPFTHRVHNVGTADFEVLDVELVRRPAQASGAVAATVAGENPSARLYKWTLAPGETAAMHTHERPYLIISATPMVLKMTGPDGKSMTYEVTAGDFHWIDAKVAHSLANAGTTAGTIVEIELK
jgi:quercetin dioxygenase-like cupin family protein